MDQQQIEQAGEIKTRAAAGKIPEKEAVRQLIELGEDPDVARYYIEAAIHGEQDVE